MKKEKTDEVSFLTNPVLFICGTILLFSSFVAAIAVAYDAFTLPPSYYGSFTDRCITTGIFVCFSVAFVGIYIFVLPQLYVRITLRPSGIETKAARKKPVVRPYTDYHYFYRASYWHGTPLGIGKDVYFIVLSHRRLKNAEIYAINTVPQDGDVICIKYSRKRLDMLLRILPREQSFSVRACFREELKQIQK